VCVVMLCVCVFLVLVSSLSFLFLYKKLAVTGSRQKHFVSFFHADASSSSCLDPSSHPGLD